MPQVYSSFITTTTESNVLYANGNLRNPKFASISVSASGDTTIVSAVSGRKIRVLHYTIICSSAVNITWKSGTTSITGAMSFGANSGISTAYSPQGLFETLIGQALVINLSGSSTVGGHLTYVEV